MKGKSFIRVAVAGVAVTLAMSAFAQVPPDPNNPNEAVPDKMIYTPYGETIKLDMAKKAAEAAVAE